MIDIYEIVDSCREQGMDSAEATQEYSRLVAEEHERVMEDYYNDPQVQEGWHQQDIIDMYRRER